MEHYRLLALVHLLDDASSMLRPRRALRSRPMIPLRSNSGILRHMFSAAVDGTPAEIDSLGPAFEFNWGAIPNVQLHAILPFGAVIPFNNPIYSPAGVGPGAFGLTDAEFGIKYGFIKQTKHRPQIGTFTMFEIPTGNSARGLGVGRVWYKLPVWVEKEFGPWSLVGGLGYVVNPQTAIPQFSLRRLSREARDQQKAGAGRGGLLPRREGLAAAQTESSTLIDAGRLLPFQSARAAIPLCLRPFGRRTDRELRLSWPL